MQCRSGYNEMPAGRPSQRPRGHKLVGLPTDATDKEAHAHQSCGRSVIELYNEKRPHSSHGLLTPAEAYDTANQNLKAAA
jgi:transposase InsO family protein